MANAIEILRWLDLVAVGALCVSTVYVLQRLLHNAHHLLRLGLVLVCAGTVIELYLNLQAWRSTDLIEVIGSLACNVGQATVYVWVANSKTVRLAFDLADQLSTYSLRKAKRRWHDVNV